MCRFLHAALYRVALSLVLTMGFAPAQIAAIDQDRHAGADMVTQTDILEAALRFYNPRGKQSRWLNREMLPQSAASAPATWPSAITDALIGRLGPGRFCTSDALQTCTFKQGGRLTVSAPHIIDVDHARVVVEFESVWPHGPAITSRQVFRLRRHESGWRIEDRSPLDE